MVCLLIHVCPGKAAAEPARVASPARLSAARATPVLLHHHGHRWGRKVIPSNFFNLPDAEHISAVLFNGAGTLTKFNRIGIGAGFSEPAAAMIHEGARFSGPALAPRPFRELVELGYPETWVDGLVVFHNPTANLPLNPDLLPGAAHHHWDGEKFTALIPDCHLDSSFSTIVQKSQRTGIATNKTEKRR